MDPDTTTGSNYGDPDQELEPAGAPPAPSDHELSRDGDGAWAEMRRRGGRQVRIRVPGAPEEQAVSGWIVAQHETTLHLRLAEAGPGALPAASAWLIDVGRAGDARYRLQCRLQRRTAREAGSGSEVVVEVLSAERLQTRSEARVPFTGRVGVVVHGGKWPRLGWLEFRDLSDSGLGGGCSVPLAIGDEFSARLRLPTFQIPLGFRGRVVRVAAATPSAEAPYGFGAVWVAPSPLFKRLVRRHVRSRVTAEHGDAESEGRAEPDGGIERGATEHSE